MGWVKAGLGGSWSLVLKALKYMTTITYRYAFRLGEAPVGYMKLLLSTSGSLIRFEVGWVRTGLVGMWRLEVLAKSWDLRQVLRLEWVIVGERCLYFWSPFLALGEFDGWHFWSFSGACFQKESPASGFGVWLLEPCYHCWVLGAILNS